MSSRRPAPSAPITLDTPPGAAPARFAGRAVTVEPALVDRLRDCCGQVDTDDNALDAASRDWWPLAAVWALAGELPARPAVVARPASASEVAAVLACCHAAVVPVTPVAGRSGVCGGSVPVFGGVSLDLTGLAGVTSVDVDSLLVDVRPGTFGDVLEHELRTRWALTLGHWPQSVALSTVGGWLACRSAGQYSTRYGKIEDMVVGLEVALADGRLVRTGGTAPRAAAGPDLTQVFVGSEGTLGVITEARLRARPAPGCESGAVYRFAGFDTGLDACRRVLRRGATPAVLRLHDAAEARRTFDVAGGDLLLVRDEGDEVLVEATMAVVDQECLALGGQRLDDGPLERWLAHRNDVSALETAVRHGLTVDTVEVAARWTALPSLYHQAVDGLLALPGTVAASAHQSHAYPDGACLYFTFAGIPDGPPDAYYRLAWEAVMTATRANGGAISHHHGVGLNRGRFLPTALGPAFEVLTGLKRTLDPNGILNPGKLGLPSPFGDAPWP